MLSVGCSIIQTFVIGLLLLQSGAKWTWIRNWRFWNFVFETLYQHDDVWVDSSIDRYKLYIVSTILFCNTIVEWFVITTSKSKMKKYLCKNYYALLWRFLIC
jgi:hypothetical protein